MLLNICLKNAYRIIFHSEFPETKKRCTIRSEKVWCDLTRDCSRTTITTRRSKVHHSDGGKKKITFDIWQADVCRYRTYGWVYVYVVYIYITHGRARPFLIIIKRSITESSNSTKTILQLLLCFKHDGHITLSSSPHPRGRGLREIDFSSMCERHTVLVHHLWAWHTTRAVTF